MSLLTKWFGNDGSAKIARDRLKIVLAHERSVKLPYMEDMKREILEVVQKYTHASKIDIKADSNQNIDTLEVEIILGK
ncbi:cell division topological specificity factor MinE [Helicobacter sp. 11S02596-1]|uniref:cell division topological specificity factor MinE n=1 Tax=Helicobacter sp. 11S02596-1 TaxID=1476194 RepID=UPI000BA78B8D|nr:cell division topological specificity factor MinE [Helicobacter sp. 11S02596-1]PAF44699.1 cell division topological specificity factor MinE [Helicobacter sp. 11S02596-1]